MWNNNPWHQIHPRPSPWLGCFLVGCGKHFQFNVNKVHISRTSSYILGCTPPFSIFTKSFISFHFSFLQVFGCLLGLGSFDSLKRPLIHKQNSLPITFNGVGLILTSTITPVVYLGSWALVVLVKVTRFMVDQHPFLFEALTWIDNNTFPF